MKKSELRQMIKEEIQLMNEDKINNNVLNKIKFEDKTYPFEIVDFFQYVVKNKSSASKDISSCLTYIGKYFKNSRKTLDIIIKSMSDIDMDIVDTIDELNDQVFKEGDVVFDHKNKYATVVMRRDFNKNDSEIRGEADGMQPKIQFTKYEPNVQGKQYLDDVIKFYKYGTEHPEIYSKPVINKSELNRLKIKVDKDGNLI